MIEFVIFSSIILPIIMLCVSVQCNNGSNPYYYITRGELIWFVLILIIPIVNWILALYLLVTAGIDFLSTKNNSDWLQGHPFRKE